MTTHQETTIIDVPLDRAQIDAMLTTGQIPDDVRRLFAAAVAHDDAYRAIRASRGPAPERRQRDRRSGGSHHVAQMLGHD